MSFGASCARAAGCAPRRVTRTAAASARRSAKVEPPMRTTSGSPAGPHARDDFAARAGHEAEIAQARQQDRRAACAVIEVGDLGEAGHDARTRRGAGQRERKEQEAWGIGRFHEPKYGFRASSM